MMMTMTMALVWLKVWFQNARAKYRRCLQRGAGGAVNSAVDARCSPPPSAAAAGAAAAITPLRSLDTATATSSSSSSDLQPNTATD